MYVTRAKSTKNMLVVPKYPTADTLPGEHTAIPSNGDIPSFLDSDSLAHLDIPIA